MSMKVATEETCLQLRNDSYVPIVWPHRYLTLEV